MEKKLRPLFGLTSNGKVKQWVIVAKGEGAIETTHGSVDGKQTVKLRPVVGKNIGRSNETTPYEQACKEAESKWNKKYDKGYRVSVDELSSIPIRPMKLQVYEDHKDKITHPALAQPKLNGVKTIVEKVDENTITYMSNGGKFYKTLSHLDKELLDTLEVGDIRDGEVYLHGEELQDISAAVKKVNDLTPFLQFWMYDVVDMEKTNLDRDIELLTYSKYLSTSHIIIVNGFMVKDEREYNIFHEEAIKKGYEGTVIRNLDGMYRSGYRSYDAQKRKDFKDEEFRIVGGTKDVDGCVIWICDTGYGKQFHVVPKGSKNSRKFYYDDREDYYGQWLTVKFLEKSKDGIPQGNPVGLCVRDYE